MEQTRRELMLATAGTTLLVGCLGDGDDGDGDDDDDSDPADDTTDDTGGDADDMEDTDETGDSDAGDTDGEDDEMDDGDGDEMSDATVQVAESEDFGEILVGPEGLSLYMFDSDEQGAGESTCYEGCAESWPPLTVEDEPMVGEDVAAELDTFEREDGAMQVTAGGWPLYYWAADEEPGDVDGQGVNDVWWLLSPEGAPITEAEESNGGGGGGPY